MVYNKNMDYRIEFYKTEDGSEPFIEWLKSLKDMDTQALIFQRLQRIKGGSFGDCDPIHDGLWEFKIHVGPGFRLYYTLAGKTVILIVAGGIKRTQKKDIKQALVYLQDYKRRFK
jgi:putative addiction module killer protein